MLENKNIRHHQNDAVVVFQHILERSPFSPVLASGGKNATAPGILSQQDTPTLSSFIVNIFHRWFLQTWIYRETLLHHSTTNDTDFEPKNASRTSMEARVVLKNPVTTKLCKYIPSPMYLVDQEPTKEIVGGQRSKPEFASDTFWHQNNTTTNPEHYSKRLWKMDDSLCWQLQFVSSFEATELGISQTHILAYPSFKTLGEF